jgi:hypothetical protein
VSTHLSAVGVRMEQKQACCPTCGASLVANSGNRATGDSSSMLLSKVKGLNAAITAQWAEIVRFRDPSPPRRFNEPVGTELCVMAPTSITFSSVSLTVYLARKCVTVDNLAPLFRGVKNLFNEKLPTGPSDAWADLSEALAKYDDLKETERTVAAIESWKLALESVHVMLGKCHEKVLALDALYARVKVLFQLAPDNFNKDYASSESHLYIFSKRASVESFQSFALEFVVVPSQEKEKVLQDAAAALLSFYQPGKQKKSGKS